MIAEQLNGPEQFSGDPAGQMKLFMNATDRAAQQTMQTHAPFEVQEGWGRDKEGNAIPTASYTGDQYQAPAGMPSGAKPGWQR